MGQGRTRAGRRPAAPAPSRTRAARPGARATGSGRGSSAAAPAAEPLASAAKPAPRAPARRGPVRPHLTGRAAILLLVLAALAVTLAWPARALVDQRRAVAALRAENRATEQRVADLRHSLDRWQDRAYVEAQARARLHFVRPGETAYVVIAPDTAPAPVTPRVPEAVAETPWFDALWQSVQGAAVDAG